MRWLVEEASADVLGTTATGETALDLAVRGQHREVTRYLLPRVIDRQLEPVDNQKPFSSIRRARSISLANPHGHQQYSPANTLVKLTDPLQRRSTQCNRFSTSEEEQPIYSEVYAPPNHQIANSS